MSNDNAAPVAMLLEIGTEDIPARFLPSALNQLKENSKAIFNETYIKFSNVKTYGTPRRLALIAEGIPLMQEDRIREVFGPSKKIAFDENGRHTKAAIGFANSQGVKAESLIVKNKDKGEYVVAVIEEKGMHVIELLPEIFKKIISSIHLPKSMRWGASNIKFIRPIRWLFALFDNKVISFEIDGIKSSNTTRGHRFLSPASFQIKEVSSYARLLSNNNVIVDPEERKKIISEETRKLSESLGGRPVEDEKLLETVSNLVEYPAPVLGSFPAEYLKLPKELLITVMREHQKYFAVEDQDRRLMNYFIVISNTNEKNAETIKIGAERVIKARFEDARFYFEEDTKIRLENRISALKNVIYQEKLGNLYDKSLRVKSLAGYLASELNPSVREKVERAAMLLKTDLITGVVREFPELQGIMAKYYAINDSEDREVSDALLEQYLPAHQGDRLPQTEAGMILSIADKIDNIVSFFSIGLIPTGSEDPFALRRQTLAVISMLMQKGYEISLNELINNALSLKTVKMPDTLKTSVLRFFEQRLEPMFLSQGYSLDVIQSLLPLSAQIPLKEIRQRFDAIKEFKNLENYNSFLTAIKRVKNILPETALPALKVSFLTTEPEKRLHEKLASAEKGIKALLKECRYHDALMELSSLTDPINNFFDNVLVMDKQEEVRLNRLYLLKEVWAVASLIAEFSRLESTTINT
ncbi:MAG: glycine--tRNA ligase subunit beta [Nitrospirae bacterium]|nr:glycine--tRNA ligase subunit beta [Nitrospirota bacterium]